MVDVWRLQPGDVIKVRENGFMGTVTEINTTYEANTSVQRSVTVSWHHLPGRHKYEANNVEDIWEKVDHIKDGNVLDEMYLPLPAGTHIMGICDHKWIDVGFSKEKLVCAYCDADKS